MLNLKPSTQRTHHRSRLLELDGLQALDRAIYLAPLSPVLDRDKPFSIKPSVALILLVYQPSTHFERPNLSLKGYDLVSLRVGIKSNPDAFCCLT